MVRLFVGGLDDHVTHTLLSSRFTSFGQVTACDIILRKEADPQYQLHVRSSDGVEQPKAARATGTGSATTTEASAEVYEEEKIPCCRGFAYVNFEPKDEAALHRCISLYNGCKWRGGVLRVERAIPVYTERLREEWEADAAAEDIEYDGEAQTDEQLPVSTKALRMTRPDTGKVVASLAEPGTGSRTLFPPLKPTRLDLLSWTYE